MSQCSCVFCTFSHEPGVDSTSKLTFRQLLNFCTPPANLHSCNSSLRLRLRENRVCSTSAHNFKTSLTTVRKGPCHILGDFVCLQGKGHGDGSVGFLTSSALTG
ncbi:hypothetical protein AMECASPLE_008832 [Ameca splendens]|uniref:Uncharacterized protein n=1 Tax=Ameca splendens TaxID=208324 RepID=A0ABV0XP43_9TELE